jgi:hypothetical protein
MGGVIYNLLFCHNFNHDIWLIPVVLSQPNHAYLQIKTNTGG